MKSFVKALLILIFMSQVYSQNIFRYSNNPIPKLNVVGIAISESTADGNNVITNMYEGMMEFPMEFTCLVDPSYKKIKDRGVVDLSLFGKSVTGKKFDSNVDSLLELNSKLFTLLLIDRQQKVRAFTQATNFDQDGFCRATEELLLNLDGQEIITVNSNDSHDMTVWQTDLAKQIEEKGNDKTLTIDFGASDKKWYKYLGETLPEINVVNREEKSIQLNPLLENKVSLLFVFVASAEPQAQMFCASIAPTMAFVNEFYETFGKGNVEPGDDPEPRAKTEP